MGNDRQAYLLAALGKIVNHLNPQRTLLARIPPGKAIAEALDAVVLYQGVRDSRRLCLESVLETPISETAASAGDELRQWLLALVNDPEYRMAGAQRTADCLAEHLRDLSRQAGDRLLAVTGQLQALRELLGDRKGSKNWLRFHGWFSSRRLVADSRLSDYFELRLHELVLNAYCRLSARCWPRSRPWVISCGTWPPTSTA